MIEAFPLVAENRHAAGRCFEEPAGRAVAHIRHGAAVTFSVMRDEQ